MTAWTADDDAFAAARRDGVAAAAELGFSTRDTNWNLSAGD